MQNEDSLITVTDDPIEVTAGRVYSRPVQVGDIVLYTADDTEHCRFGVVDRAAMVTAVEPDCCVSLCAFEPGGFAFVRGARFSVERVSGTWRHRELCACGCRVHERTPRLWTGGFVMCCFSRLMLCRPGVTGWQGW